VDVTPREADPTVGPDGGAPEARRPRRRRNPAAYVLLLLVVVGLGVVLFQGLNNAALYYRNVDEALHDKGSIGTSRFRVQGTVQDDVKQVDGEVDFTIRYNGTDPAHVDDSIPVHHRGDPPELFKAGVPVVLEGHFQGDFFVSDRILIKHTAEYKESNPDRVSSDAP
jgi:cytochrome c-type biogenesis protein CcmE